MQLKCPGCSRALKIPESAAGKVVKCPCGKQLRVPGGQAATSGRPQASRQRPAAGQAAASTKTPPASTGGGFGGFDAEMFDELTESDMRPVNIPKAANAPAPPSNAASNPYASPASSGASSGTASSHSGKAYASQNKRLINYFVDGLIFQFGAFCMGFVIGLIWVVGGDGEAPDPSAEMTFTLVVYAISAIAFLLYYAGMEFLFAATPAKFLTGTRVVSSDGNKAGFGKILGRTFARMIPFDPFSFCFGDTTTGWHDTLSGTRVIDIKA